jgi:hypothetical protein
MVSQAPLAGGNGTHMQAQASETAKTIFSMLIKI